MSDDMVMLADDLCLREQHDLDDEQAVVEIRKTHTALIGVLNGSALDADDLAGLLLGLAANIHKAVGICRATFDENCSAAWDDTESVELHNH